MTRPPILLLTLILGACSSDGPGAGTDGALPAPDGLDVDGGADAARPPLPGQDGGGPPADGGATEGGAPTACGDQQCTGQPCCAEALVPTGTDGKGDPCATTVTTRCAAACEVSASHTATRTRVSSPTCAADIDCAGVKNNLGVPYPVCCQLGALPGVCASHTYADLLVQAGWGCHGAPAAPPSCPSADGGPDAGPADAGPAADSAPADGAPADGPPPTTLACSGSEGFGAAAAFALPSFTAKASRRFDIDGDLRPDLVVSANADPTVGTSRWLVYKNTGAGLAPSPVDWSLPTGPYDGYAFTTNLERSHSTCDGTGNTPGYRVFDIDGDARPDIVVSDACDDPAVGKTKWRVHKNTGTGFAAGADWPLPPFATSQAAPFIDTAEASGKCYKPPLFDLDMPRYRVFDIDGDGKPDMVLPDDCADADVGKSKWLVHKNTGQGFAQTAVSWALPPFKTTDTAPFTNSLIGVGTYCGSDGLNTASYRVFDIDGDSRPDFVFSHDCDDVTVGQSKWRVFVNSGGGFAQTGLDWALPPLGGDFANTEKDFLDCGGTTSKTIYRVFDIDGDLRPEVVFSAHCADPTVGLTRWLVYDNSGVGFAQSAGCWSLPSAAPSVVPPFWVSDGATTVPFTYEVYDLDGDLRVDLVFTRDQSDSAVGQSKWTVHFGK